MIGGTVVKSYYDTSISGPYPANTVLGTNQASANLTVNFDSTYFPDVNPISIQMTAQDSGGAADNYTTSIQAGAYNDGYVNYEPIIDSSQNNAQVADAGFSDSNIAPNDGNPTDTRDSVLAGVRANSDFFIASHGLAYAPTSTDPVYFAAPEGIGNNNDVLYFDQYVDPSSSVKTPRDDVAEAVAGKSANTAPYNFG